LENSLETDTRIIEEIRAGNIRRFSELVDRHKNRAMTLAFRLIGAKEDAEEVVQDAFVRAFRNLGEFRGDAKFATWFYRIVYNLCMTRLRQRRTAPDMVNMDTVEERILADEEGLAVHERIDRADFQTLVQKEIQDLPDRYKSAITLFYVQEMNYEEIAQVLGKPLGTVKTDLFRGRNILRRRVLGELHGKVNVA
jgi:RNA polymerase sigma-70 factor (ECF subfamily)